MTDEEHKAIQDKVQKAVDSLIEHGEAVQVLLTYSSGDGCTHAVSKGKGNHYARVGLVREFLIRDNAMTDQDERPNNPPDDGESWKEK